MQSAKTNLCEQCKSINDRILDTSTLALENAIDEFGNFAWHQGLKICDYWYPSDEAASSNCGLCRLLNYHHKPPGSFRTANKKGYELLLWLSVRESRDTDSEKYIVHFRTINLKAKSQPNVVEYDAYEDRRRLMVSLNGSPPEQLATSRRVPHDPRGIFRRTQVSSPLLIRDQIDFSPIHCWLQRCRLCHPRCQRQANAFLGTSVIECSTNCIIPAPPECVYAALSYVWGGVEHKSNSDSKLPGRLARTIQDAITVCQILKINYLWVDRYCIDYNDPLGASHQINNMHRSYSQAELTIIVGDGKNAEAGLPGVSDTPRRHPPPVKLEHLTISQYPPHASTESHAGSLWATRGWTYQENFFSRRRLNFRNEEVIFSCSSGMVCHESEISVEDALLGVEGKQQLPKSPKMLRRKQYRTADLTSIDQALWRTHPFFVNLGNISNQIGDYTARKLTYDEDSLRAFSGVLQHFSELEYPIAHPWGIPFIPIRAQGSEDISPGETSFLSNLCWIHEKHHGQWRLPMSRRKDFPSWAWAGWSGPVEMLDPNPRDHPLARVFIDHEDGHSSRFDASCFASLTDRREFAFPHAVQLDAIILSSNAFCEQTKDIVYRGSYYEWRIGKNFLRTLELSRPEDYHGDLQHYFSRQYLQAIILLERHGRFYALIVRKSSDAMERVGRMCIRERNPTINSEDDWDLYEDQNSMHFYDEDEEEEEDWGNKSLEEATKMLERLKEETGSSRCAVHLS